MKNTEKYNKLAIVLADALIEVQNVKQQLVDKQVETDRNYKWYREEKASNDRLTAQLDKLTGKEMIGTSK